jgi:protein TonB
MMHLCALFLASAIMSNKADLAKNFIPITLVDAPREAEPVALTKTSPKPIKKSEPLVTTIQAAKDTPQALKPESSLLEKLTAVPSTVAVKEESAKPVETKPVLPAGSLPGFTKVEDGGSEAGAANLFGRGDLGIIPGSGMASGGGGTAVAGLGRGSRAPGLPAQSTVLRANREAKPIQSARPNYPAVAFRLGLEGDVLLKIEVDAQGKVTKAEILKSAWAGFNEEALRAVKQSSFEPAQRDGQNIPAEFTYIYRFCSAK